MGRPPGDVGDVADDVPDRASVGGDGAAPVGEDGADVGDGVLARGGDDDGALLAVVGWAVLGGVAGVVAGRSCAVDGTGAARGGGGGAARTPVPRPGGVGTSGVVRIPDASAPSRHPAPSAAGPVGVAAGTGADGPGAAVVGPGPANTAAAPTAALATSSAGRGPRRPGPAEEGRADVGADAGSARWRWRAGAGRAWSDLARCRARERVTARLPDHRSSGHHAPNVHQA